MSKILIDEATVKLVLGALENHSGNYKLSDSECVTHIAAVEALKELAEQPAQQCKWPTCQSEEYQQALAEQIKRELVGEQPAQQEPVEWMELLREARDNCKASIVEEGISAGRKEYRIDLEARLTAALNTSPQPAQHEPVAKDNSNYRLDPPWRLDPLYTTPQPAQQEPVAYWIPKAKQFCIADTSGRPFAKAWEPLYTSPPAQRKPLTKQERDLIHAATGSMTFFKAVEHAISQTEEFHNIKENT